MSQLILTQRITAQELAAVRTHAREVGEFAGLETLQQTRFATAVSEIARNTVQYAVEGRVRFLVRPGPGSGQRSLVAQLIDGGPGIADLQSVLGGRAVTVGGRPSMGILGSRRLVDRLQIETPAEGGTRVELELVLPATAPHHGDEALTRFAQQLAARHTRSPNEELDRQNRELLRTLAELREKQIELQQADEMKNRFVTMLAHELRSPLATLAMSLELMRRKPNMAGDELAQRREVMARQTGQMTKLVEDLMDVARVRQGKVQLERRPVELNTLVTQSVEMTSAAVAAKSHHVCVSLNEGPLWVDGDAARLTQVLCNLLQNAARYTASGGAIDVRLERDPSNAMIHVQDNGIGIAAEVLPHIFGLFVQGHGLDTPDSADGPGESGLGLGLTLVHHLVNEHGGAVSAHSDGLGRGSRFCVRLPLMAPQPAPA